MGSLFSKSTPKPPQQQQPAANTRKVQVNEGEVVVAKLKIQIDRLESRLKKLQNDDKTVEAKVRAAVASKKKEEAYFYLKQKKTVREAVKSTQQRLEFVQRQVDNIETAIDDAKFTDIVKDSNKTIEKLSKEIDMEEIRIAKELQQEGKLRREELEQLLEDDADAQELRDELDAMEAQMVGEEFSKHQSAPIKDAGKTTTPVRKEEKSELRGQMLAN